VLEGDRAQRHRACAHPAPALVDLGTASGSASNTASHSNKYMTVPEGAWPGQGHAGPDAGEPCRTRHAERAATACNIALATRAPGWSVRLSTLAMAGWPHRTSPPLHLDVLVVIDLRHQDGDLCLFLLCPQGRI
jgi:hypothetical protein